MVEYLMLFFELNRFIGNKTVNQSNIKNYRAGKQNVKV